MTYRPLVEASGFMQVAHAMRHDEIETVLYERVPLERAFPVREEKDFVIQPDHVLAAGPPSS